jgi:asparagine synthase (glutamine-hydrolysing)
MCGIVGKISFNNTSVTKEELKRMADTIAHRGPDGEGYWVNETENIGFAHRRLAIIDLSEKGHQPMHFDNLTITYNGEIYNYIELKNQLQDIGYKFNTDTDTEVILAYYKEYGDKCIEYFDGMFAFVIYNHTTKEVFCARDRFGEKPFYYYADKTKFIFASEMKAIFAEGIQKSINNHMACLYLAHDVVENPNDKEETFYSNIYNLPASSYLKVEKDGEISIKKYWDIDLNKVSELSFNDAKNHFLELFNDSIKKRLRSDVNVGCSLSGGVDSSAIVASIMTLFPKQNLKTFTARFNDEIYDEGKYVDLMKDKYSFNAMNCYPQSAQIINDLDLIFHHQEEPFGSASIIAQWEVMKTARNNSTTVLLDGQGADETLGGYYKYFVPYLYEIRNNKRKFNPQLKKIESHLNINKYLSTSDEIRMKSPVIYDLLRRYSENIFKNSFAPDLAKDFKSEYLSNETLFHRDTKLNNFLSKEIFNYGLGKLLRFSDRNAMAHGVEVRLPYLSHNLVEFIFSLPSQYKINDGWTKYILRESIKHKVPAKIVFRKDKRGFDAPVSWLKENKIIERVKDAEQQLIQKGFINIPDKNKSWQYLMTSKLIENI